MLRKRRSNREGSPPNGQAPQPLEVPAPPPPPPSPAPTVGVVLVGPETSTREWFASVLPPDPHLRLLATFADFESASLALKEVGRRHEVTVLIDAFAQADEPRSVIRSVRERFPSVRVIAYGDDLDELAIEGLYFIGADAVVVPGMAPGEVVGAILGSAPDRPAAVSSGPDVPESTGPEDVPLVEERALEPEEAEEIEQEPPVASPAHQRSSWSERMEAIWGPRAGERAKASQPETIRAEARGTERAEVSEAPAPQTEEAEVSEAPTPQTDEEPVVEPAAPSDEEERPQAPTEERETEEAASHRKRSVARGMSRLRFSPSHRSERPPRRVKHDRRSVREDQHDAALRNLERLVPPWEPPQEDSPQGEEGGSEEAPDDRSDA